jgi:integrase
MTFYKVNDIEPRGHRIKQYLPEDYKAYEDRAYKPQEIQRLLEFCDQRLKALILLLASSGIRVGAAAELKIKNLTKIENPSSIKSKYMPASKNTSTSRSQLRRLLIRWMLTLPIEKDTEKKLRQMLQSSESNLT